MCVVCVCVYFDRWGSVWVNRVYHTNEKVVRSFVAQLVQLVQCNHTNEMREGERVRRAISLFFRFYQHTHTHMRDLFLFILFFTFFLFFF